MKRKTREEREIAAALDVILAPSEVHTELGDTVNQVMAQYAELLARISLEIALERPTRPKE